MIVWLTGRLTSGKTWLGDFLERYHGWTHVEGDKVKFVENDSEVSENLVKSFYEYWFFNKEAPLELWIGYFQRLCDDVSRVLKEKPGSNVVVSFSTYPRAVREFVRKQIEKDTGEELVFVLLEVSVEEYVKRSVVRYMDFVKNSGKSIEEQWDSNKEMKKLGAYSQENLTKFFTDADFFKGLEPLDANDSNSYTINANENHRYVVPEISRILNLPKVENIDVDQVKQMQLKRWTRYTKLKEERENTRALSFKEEKEGVTEETPRV